MLAGACSACWEHLERAGVFRSEEASDYCKKFMQWFYAHMKEKPMLGFATNQQLLEELETRHEFGHKAADYRVVDHDG